VQTIAGSGTASYVDGYGTAAAFNTHSTYHDLYGVMYTADYANYRIRQLTCLPCPAGFTAPLAVPVICPAGSYCPLSSVNPTACAAGSYSASGASSCTNCAAGYYSSATGASSCIACTAAAGYGCAAGSTSNTGIICPVGSYCRVVPLLW
jgi:hypothetical protein